jgi:hypothetical protein
MNWFSCSDNELTELDISNYPLLELLACSRNMIPELDLSNNLNLVSLYNTLGWVTHYNLDNHVYLETVKLNGGNVYSLSIKNGANTLMDTWGDFYLKNNLHLDCVTVDDPAYSIATWLQVDHDLEFSTDCESLSVTEERGYEYEVYPNPASEFLFIDVNSNDYKVKVYAVNGEVLMSANLNEGRNSLDVSGLAKGMYFVEMIKDGSIYMEQIIIQ